MKNLLRTGGVHKESGKFRFGFIKSRRRGRIKRADAKLKAA